VTCNIPGGYSQDPANSTTCLLCHSTCETCSNSDDAYSCLSCNAPNTLSSANNCYFQCGVSQYKVLPIDPLGDDCLPCHFSCETCSGPLEEDCNSCPLNNPLEDNSSVTVYEDSGLISATFTQKGKCILPCPSGEFVDPGTGSCVGCPTNCQNCVSLTECTSCTSAYQLYEVTLPTAKIDCLLWCEPGEYRKPDGTCESCYAGCK
jgi:proprotein convertase subtilisin/kexin type 5